MALVVLLRGVNVGGHKTFRPSRLARELDHYGAVNIGSAGTFVIRRQAARKELRSAIARRLPFEAGIVICAGREIVALASRDFFAGEAERPDVVRFVSVLSRKPRSAPPVPLRLPTTGDWMVRVLAREGRFLVGVHRRHMRVIGHLGDLDRVFGAPATTRGWSTIVKLAELLEAPG